MKRGRHHSYDRFMAWYNVRQDRRASQQELDRIRRAQGADDAESDKLEVKKFRRPWWW